MGIMVYSLQWVMQDFVHQPFVWGNLVKAPPHASVESVWLKNPWILPMVIEKWR